jgi:hypothetical protein
VTGIYLRVAIVTLTARCRYYVEECNGATWDTTKRPSKLYPEGYDKVPDVVKEENFDDAIPIAGGSGGGAVTAGMLGPDRLPSRKQLAPPQKPLVDKDGYEIAQPPNSKAARNARTSMQRKSVSTKENLVGLGASTADAADAKVYAGRSLFLFPRHLMLADWVVLAAVPARRRREHRRSRLERVQRLRPRTCDVCRHY